jgi:rubrerythrin
MIGEVTVAKCVELAIQTEQMGGELYRLLAGKFAPDPELRELFEGLGSDEARYRERFRALRDRALARPRGGPLSEAQQAHLRSRSLAGVLSRARAVETDVEAIQTRRDALERALGLERATFAFYQAMREVLGDDDILESLIAVEEDHVVRVMGLLVREVRRRAAG